MDDLLREALRLHEEWLRTGGSAGRRADFSGADLRMHELENALLDHALLRGANLERANLRGASLCGVDLRRAALGYANLDAARLDAADLSRCAAPGVRLRRATLRGAQLSEARLDDALCEGADFSGSQARRASLKRANLSRAVLDGVRFEDVALTDADLTGASVQRATLVGVHLLGAELHGATVRDTEVDEVAVEPGIPGLDKPEAELALTARDQRRALRLHRSGKSVGEIARAIGVSRVVVRNSLEGTDLEIDRRAHLRHKVRHARTVGVLAFTALSVAALALLLLVAAGLVDLGLIVWRGQPAAWPVTWYLLWVVLGVAGAAGGLVALGQRERLLDRLARLRAKLPDATVEAARATADPGSVPADDPVSEPPRSEA